MNLFHSSHFSSSEAWDFLPITIVSLSLEDYVILSSLVFDKEIKQAIFSMKPFKAPGADGFHAGFYQQCWPTIGESIVNVVKHIFFWVSLPDGINHTLLTLVPKCECPESLNPFRPVSLCNSLYKIVTKVLVNRLRIVIPSLISPFQIAIVPGQQGMDNVVIVQEIVHVLSRRKGRVGGMAIKINIFL